LKKIKTHAEQAEILTSNFWFRWTGQDENALNDPVQCAEIWEEFQSYMNSDSWYSKYKDSPKDLLVAFFSIAFGIDPSLPIYSGGLGVLAGDHLKSASDLGLPLIGVGLYYHKGFFHQILDSDGRQSEKYPEIDLANIPAELVLDETNKPIKITVELEGVPLYSQVWKVKVGRVILYLLDSNIPENSAEFREVTARLYDGGRENRIRQEILLGIGGVKALQKMGIKPNLFHMTEGHSVFLSLERARMLRNESGNSFAECAENLKKSTIFTIHTPVQAGNETFSLGLTKKYFENYSSELGLSWEEFEVLGKDSLQPELFSLTVMALRMAGNCNGVSRLHGETSRKLWQHLWHDLPQDEVPITHITNGVHPRTWLSDEMLTALKKVQVDDLDFNFIKRNLGESVSKLSDRELWDVRNKCKTRLISFVRAHYQKLINDPNRRKCNQRIEQILSPNTLTIGFARRLASYKRATLLLRDKDRLIRLLKDPDHPIQFIFSGKAHPQNFEGKDMLQDLIRFSIDAGVQDRIIFIENYDMQVALHMIQGVDVWLSNPRRPQEASSTSGMKAIINGSLNVCTLDGWWEEAYQPYLGWLIGDGEESEDTESLDSRESEDLFRLLETEIAPLYYSQDSTGIPLNWLKMIRRSINQLGTFYTSHRMLKAYVNKFYIPAYNNLPEME